MITSWRSQNQNRDGYHLRNGEIVRCPITFPNTIMHGVQGLKVKYVDVFIAKCGAGHRDNLVQ